MPDPPLHRLRFGAQVRRLRAELGWSQEQLAERADLHRNYVGGVERAERNVSIDNIVALAAALGVRPGDLFGDEGEDQSP